MKAAIGAGMDPGILDSARPFLETCQGPLKYLITLTELPERKKGEPIGPSISRPMEKARSESEK